MGVMRGRVIRALAVAFWACTLVGLPAAAQAAEKYAAYLVDADTGRVLVATNPDEPRYPASLTKMMTLYLAFDALKAGRITLDQQLPVSARAQAQSPSKLGLVAGRTIRAQDAILGLVTRSANDAAVVLAEALGGSEEAFAQMMTARAQAIGMTNSRFRNASGLPNPNQITTARDMVTLGLALMRDHPRYYPYFSTKTFAYRGQQIGNHNKLLARYEGTDGIKTGFTNASGFNLVASVKREGHHVVGAVFGGSSGRSRDDRMIALMNYAFADLRGDAISVAKLDLEPKAKAAAKTTSKQQANAMVAALEPKVSAKPRAPVRLEAAQGDDEEAADAAAARGTKWAVQVGAFKAQAPAAKRIQQARAKAPVALKGAKSQVVAVKDDGKTVYRARLVGLSEAKARDACRAIRQARMACVLMPPTQQLAAR